MQKKSHQKSNEIFNALTSKTNDPKYDNYKLLCSFVVNNNKTQTKRRLCITTKNYQCLDFIEELQALLSEETNSHISTNRKNNSDLLNSSFDSVDQEGKENGNKETKNNDDEKNQSLLAFSILSQNADDYKAPNKESDQVKSNENEKRQDEIKDRSKNTIKDDEKSIKPKILNRKKKIQNKTKLKILNKMIYYQKKKRMSRKKI